MAVSRGKLMGSFPSSRRASSIAASAPEAVDSTYPSTPVICPANMIRSCPRTR